MTSTTIAALLVAGLSLAGCRQEVQFTKVPPLSQRDTAVTQAPTNIYVGVPISLNRLKDEAERSVPPKFKKLVTWLDDAACQMRGRYERCVGARAELVLERDGPIKLLSRGDKLQIKLPLKYNLFARGLRRARNIRETKTGKLTAIASLSVRLDRGLKPEVSLSDAVNWSLQTIDILKGRIDVARFASGKVKRSLRDAIAAFDEDMNAAPIRATAARAWKALQTPVALGGETDTWLNSTPVSVSDGGFTAEDGQLFYRVAIASKLYVQRGEQPEQVIARKMPRRISRSKAAARSVIPFPIKIGYGATREALQQVWPKPITVRTKNKKLVMNITVRGGKVYPSRGQVALGLDLDVETPRRAFDLTGSAYLTAQPVIDPATGTLEMRNIKLADTIAIPGVGAATGQRLRLPEEPFIEGFGKALRVDVSKELGEVVAKANRWFDQPIGEGLMLRGEFTAAEINSIQAMTDGFHADVGVTGQMLVVETARQELTSSDAAPGPAGSGEGAKKRME